MFRCIQSLTKVEAPAIFRGSPETHMRTFKWGIGNRFRSNAENALRPVHKARPHMVSVRSDYYDRPLSEADGRDHIEWDNLNEAWEVFWFEHGKLNAKPFPVKKFGVEPAKLEAIAFFRELKRTKPRLTQREFESPSSSVRYDERLQSWTVRYWEGGRPQVRSYSASQHGLVQAKAKAAEKL